ncbi:TadE/TadG family type IV pilus assembly protein [Sphingomonas sp. BAUL-RG-20F-R05-02]|uniref:TadE/TadG family type IV pilus assembly protein n=1 Tax=Sphingomonas sp. BAUL-RG-20F-R05-02 TaxID=2914830 RepID=UPI001F588735|nr:TadE/TadG family type IV pilus assembly protein [Sphingomonas sp. BAUL-RG-20F-R05-02]
MIRRPHQRLADDRRGSTALEFGLIAPVMLLMMMGLGDLLYQAYSQAVLNGAIQKAARDSSVEGGASNTDAIDAKVVKLMVPLIKNLANNCAPTGTTASWCSTRKTYDSFSEVAPEPFTDTNGNGVRDPGECYTDENGNGSWDADPGLNGQGGASAVTLYTMSITYPRVFPVAGLLKLPTMQTITASTLIKNQPYAAQTVSANVTICT